MELLNGSRSVPIWLLAACMAVPAGAQPRPDVVLRGEIDASADETYRLVPFDVPPGTQSIDIEFEHGGRKANTVVDIGLLGPDGFHGADGFRGWSGGNKASFTVSRVAATPSYLSGPLTPGEWNLLLGIPNIRAGQTAEFEARIRFEQAGDAAAHGRGLSAEPGWYRGDLHLHTGHSDGTCDSRSGANRVPCPLFLTLAAAADRGLDFAAVTEHNTVSHVGELTALQPYFDELLLISGLELTTFQGHANVFGITRPIDFRVGSEHVPDWNAVLDEIAERGAVTSINHPNVPSGEVCLGCGWHPQPAADLAKIDAVEIVNGNDAETAISGIPYWHAQLDRGRRLTGIGGSDTHDVTANERDARTGRVGVPTTVVHAQALSVAAIQQALRDGNVFVDVEGSDDRLLEMKAGLEAEPGDWADPGAVPMGSELMLARGEAAWFEVRVSKVRRARIDVIRDGHVLDPPNASYDSDPSAGEQVNRLEFREVGDGRRHWIRIDVRDEHGDLLLIGNPIYVIPE